MLQQELLLINGRRGVNFAWRHIKDSILLVFAGVFFARVRTLASYILFLLMHSFIWFLFIKMGPSPSVEQACGPVLIKSGIKQKGRVSGREENNSEYKSLNLYSSTSTLPQKSCNEPQNACRGLMDRLAWYFKSKKKKKQVDAFKLQMISSLNLKFSWD